MFKVIIQRVATPKEANKRAIELSKQQLWQLMKTLNTSSPKHIFAATVKVTVYRQQPHTWPVIVS